MTDVATLPNPGVESRNQRLLDHVRGRLCERTSAGQCILHLSPGGEIGRIEWREFEKADDILDV